MKCPICEKELTQITDDFEVNTSFGKMKGVIYECCDRQIIQQNLIKEDL